MGTAHNVNHDVEGVGSQRADQVRPSLQRQVRAFGQDVGGLLRGADGDHSGTAAFRELDGGETDSSGCARHQNPLRPDAGAMHHVFRRRICAGNGGQFSITPVRVDSVGLPVRRYRELGEPAIAFPSQSPTFEGTVPHIAAQHVPHEDPLPDPFFGNTLTDSGDSSAYVRALDPGKCHGFTRPRRIGSRDRQKPIPAAGIGIRGHGLGIPANPRIDIGVVDSGGGDFDQDLPVPRAGYGNVCPVIELIQTTVSRKQRSCHNLR